MSRIAALFTCLTLAACGVDGAPSKPNGEAPAPNGVTVSGSAKVGVAGST